MPLVVGSPPSVQRQCAYLILMHNDIVHVGLDTNYMPGDALQGYYSHGKGSKPAVALICAQSILWTIELY